ncbi:MAG: SurA N-terminal domain-containing protein [Muribaculaceae bacterium]|nr:SurA N-terminal domain-containing protein [Muribaculaceae bacterium]
MATLEKIRKRSVLLLIVIAVALLAFILGDAISNGRNLFGNGTTVAKVGSEKIDVTELQQRQEQLNQQLEEARRNNPQSVANFDAQTLSQLAIDQLITEHLFNSAVEKMGIKSSPEILRFYMLENPQMMPELQNVVRAAQQISPNVATAQQAYDVIFSPQKYNIPQSQVEGLQRAWLAAENKYKLEIAKMTYGNLLQRTLKANKLDKKALYNDFVATSSVSMAFAPYGQIDPKKYPVSDAEIQKAYSEDRGQFRVEEPTKEVAFIAVNVSASKADLDAAKALAKKVEAQLANNATLDKDLKKEGLSADRRELRVSDLPAGPLKEFLISAPADTVKIVESNDRGFSVVKMGKRYAALDSIEVRMVQVAGNKLPAKVLARLNSGLAPDSVSSAFSPDSVMAAPAQWIPLFTAEGKSQTGLSQSQLDSLVNAGGRFITINESADGAVLASVSDKKGLKDICEFTEVNYTIQPSAKTLEDAVAKFEKFLADNNSAAKFKANAEKAGYNLQEFQFTQSTPAVPRFQGYNMYFPDSRQVVRWAMIDGEKGQVSHIYESKDAVHPTLYAVAIMDEYDDFVPVTNSQVKEILTDKVRRSKVGDEKVKAFSKHGNNMAAVARDMGVEPREIAEFRFGQGATGDAAVTGRIAGSKPGQKLLLLKGEDGVYAVIVKGQSKAKFDYDDATYDRQFMQMINPDMAKMLRGSKKVVNNSYRFEAGS